MIFSILIENICNCGSTASGVIVELSYKTDYGTSKNTNLNNFEIEFKSQIFLFSLKKTEIQFLLVTLTLKKGFFKL